MKDFDEQDDLWQLLGKAKKQADSPLFSRNVLREIRLSRQEKAGVFSWLRNRWRLATACTIAAVLLGVSASRMFVPHKAPAQVAIQSTDSASDASKPDDTEVITHLDELVAYEENSIWLEDSSK
jgi:hypothetical protein